MQRIVQIVPRFWPSIDGVGDFSRQLGKELQERFGIESQFLVADRDAVSSPNPNIWILKEHNASRLVGLLEHLDPDLVLLHYSGYGYHDRGVPDWLVDGLEHFLLRTVTRLAVFFHEIWASGPPWKREFYSQHGQKRLVRRLESCAGVVFTSTPRMQRLLQPALGRPVLVPIPSPVLPVEMVRETNRDGGVKLAIFGQEHSRARSLKAHAGLICHLAMKGQLGSLTIVGKDTDRSETIHLGSDIVSKTIVLPNADAKTVGEILLGADALLSFYPAHLLTKSSSAMAAFACGCPVILTAEQPEDHFVPPPPFLICDGSAADISRLLAGYQRNAWTDVARDARAWYGNHASWDCAIRHIAPRLGIPSKPELAVA